MVTGRSWFLWQRFSPRSRNSAAYKGLNVLILREGAKDFFWKASIQELDGEDIALDIHHIFPRAWCENEGILANTFNSIVNKTPISYKANWTCRVFVPLQVLV